MNHCSRHSARPVRILFLAALLPLAAGCMNIHKAANRGDLAGVRGFVQAGTAVDARDAYGRTPLMYMLSDLESVRYLVEAGADVNARDQQGETPLMRVAFLGKLDVARYLVQKGADVNARSEAGTTPLMKAIRHLDLVKFLVEQGADLNAVDLQGESPLLKASVAGRLGTVQYLLKKGAAVEGGDEGKRAR